MKTTVLIAFAEALSAPEVAWSLVDAGYEVVALARRGRRAALRHSHCVNVIEITAPESDTAAALRELLGVVDQQPTTADRRTVLFPLDDAAVWLCNEAGQKRAVLLAGPMGSNAELALNKRVQVELAQAAGFNVPNTAIVTTTSELLTWKEKLPVVLRQAEAVVQKDGCVQKGRYWLCATGRELEAAASDWSGTCSLLVQPFIHGTGEGVFGLAVNGRIEAWSAHRRVRMMNPHGSGSSACISQPVTSQMQAVVEEMIQRSGWRGLFMVELLRDGNGTPWFVEFNGRPWGSMALSRRQGFEYPAWAVNAILDSQQRPDLSAVRARPLMCRNIGREMLHLLFVARGPKSKAVRNWPSFWRTLLDLLRIRPGDTLYNWRRNDLRVFFCDCWYTLRNNLFKSNG